MKLNAITFSKQAALRKIVVAFNKIKNKNNF